MNDMSQAITPRSDQLNADDLLCGPITIKITEVSIKAGQEQPVSLSYENDNGKPYKPCKSMCRVLVAAWGPDASKYKGRSLTLYCDPKVRWGGMEVGGLRISHMSHIDAAMTMALTVTRANKKPFTVKPIVNGAPKAVDTQTPESARTGPDSPSGRPSASSAATSTQPIYITENEQLSLIARCDENGIDIARLKKAAGVSEVAKIESKDLSRAQNWISAAIAAKSQAA